VHAWPAPEIPDLPGTGLPLRLHDSATGQVRPTAPGPTARMYVCGITPYDATHIGHAATYVTFDLVHRAWLDAGHDVHYVQNVTDVDDPLLERAARDGEDWAALADRETTLFREDMTSLGVLPPRNYVGAVESIPDVVAAVRTLREQGAAYDVDGDTYFSVHSDPRFGGVGNLDYETMAALLA
jgi:L-cysteine:1D-myo-inositol 2-amino-2-deoxy-alpha-D-glucopyranoside ligase